MTAGWRSCGAAIAVAIGLAAPLPGSAEDVWPVEGKLFGEDKRKAEDVSGLACMEPSGFPRRCLAIDDESQGAQIVILKDGALVAGDVIPLIDDAFGGEPLAFDGEAVAYADGAFYVMGSHGHPRDPRGKLDPRADKAEIDAAIAASSAVFRIRLSPDAIDDRGRLTTPARPEALRGLRDALMLAPALQPFVDRRLDRNGLTIEGAAVRGGALFVGFRAPVVEEGGTAVVIETPLGVAAGTEPTRPPTTRRLRLGEGKGVRDLAPLGDGFLVLAGPSADPPKTAPVRTGDYALFRWDGADRLEKVADLEGRRDADGDWTKPEAVLPLGDGRCLILSDGGKEGAPRTVPAGC